MLIWRIAEHGYNYALREQQQSGEVIVSEYESIALERPLVVWDGECGFCRMWVVHWWRLTSETVDYTTFQEAAEYFPQIPREDFERAVHLFLPDGTVYKGAAAVFALLKDTPNRGWWWWLYSRVPGFDSISESFYSVIARHRDAAYRLTKLLWGDDVGPHSYALTRWLFLRMLGVIYLIAFGSFAVQIPGLIGSGGILPVGDYLAAVEANPRFVGIERYHVLPTLAWLNSSDPFLMFLAVAGIALAILLILDIANLPVSVLLWIFYLSLMRVGQTFWSFQWDTLLLETGFLAIFLAPLNMLPRFSRTEQPSMAIVWLFRWLIFRLMWGSGIVKYLSGDPAWSDLTAVSYHYESQPLPNPFSWYAHQLPMWAHQLSTLGMFVVELIVPLLALPFWPRRVRFAAAFSFVFLMILIALTGNYNFFNLLTVALCIMLLDDTLLRRFVPSALREMANWQPAANLNTRSLRRSVRGALLTVLVILVVFLSTFAFIRRTFPQTWESIPASIRGVHAWFNPFYISSGYGLFQVMTKGRSEIVIEGSMDGETWYAYEFYYKIGDVNRTPPFIAPHQPRLDWQMWFAALQGCCQDWFVSFLRGLLEGDPQIIALLETNPFPTDPPIYIRAMLYDYRFSTPEERAETGAWWVRSDPQPYVPAITLEDVQPERVP